jgi:hypothetical protein
LRSRRDPDAFAGTLSVSIGRLVPKPMPHQDESKDSACTDRQESAFSAFRASPF